MLASLVLISFVIVLFGIWYIKRKRKYGFVKHIPGPTTIPVFGNALEFGTNAIESLKGLCRILDTFGPISRIWIGPGKLYLLVSDPDFCKILLTSNKYTKKALDYNLLHPWIGDGLLLTNGSNWQKKRKIITPAFHFKILEQFVPMFNTASDILVQKLSANINKCAFDVCPYLKSFTLDVICETAMGTTVNAQENPDNEYVAAVKTLCNICISRVYSFWKQYDILFKFTREYKRQTEALKIVHGFIDYVIKQRHAELQANNDINSNVSDEYGMQNKFVFLDLLLRSTIDGKPLTKKEIREETNTFMFEGHDSTASLISFALYEIAKNPNIQHKIMNELESIFADNKSRKPNICDLNNMKYLDLVIKESLRMYPPAPYFGREIEEDIHYKGILYPKGLMVSVVTLHMHRRSDLYKDSHIFNPDRFLAENLHAKYQFSYLPFSAGPRNCIGQKFAVYEMKVTLANIVRNFIVQPSDTKCELILSGELVMKAANGVFVKLKKRDF